MPSKSLAIAVTCSWLAACSGVDSPPPQPVPPSAPVSNPGVSAPIVNSSTNGVTRFTGEAVPQIPQLGLSFPGSNPKYYGYMKEAGIGTVRISASWKSVEPRQGRYDWSGLDRRIIGLQEQGIDPFVTFESNVEWATTANTFGKVKNGTPKSIELWDAYVTAVVERYNGNGLNDAPGLRAPVKWYQAANEWVSPTNKSGGWAGRPSDLITYINTAYDAVKRTDPSANFVMGGVASTNLDLLVNALSVGDYEVRQYNNDGKLQVYSKSVISSPRIQDAIQGLVKPVLRDAKYDYLDLHLYGPERRDPARVRAMQSIAKPVPMLTSECGGPSLDYGDERYDPEDHFFAALHRNLMIQSLDMPFCLWFRLGESKGATWGNEKTALFDIRQEPKPGYMAYKLLAVMMDGVSGVQNLSTDSLNYFRIERAGRAAIDVRWRADHAPLSAGDLSGLNGSSTRLVSNVDSGRSLDIHALNSTAKTYVAVSSADLPAAIR